MGQLQEKAVIFIHIGYMSCTGGQMCYTDGTVIAVDLSRNGIDQG